MWRTIRRLLMLLLAAVFLFCGGTVAVVQHQYNVNKRLYRAASDSFTAPVELNSTQTKPTAPKIAAALPFQPFRILRCR